MANHASRALLCSGLAVFLAIRAGAESTSLDEEVIHSMTEASDLIVLGKVIEIGQPGDGTTWINLKVKKVLKGAASDNMIAVTIPGGLVRGSDAPLTVEGQPHFQEKELVIVFLSISGDHFEIVGAEKGKQPGEGSDARDLQLCIKTYLSKKPFH